MHETLVEYFGHGHQPLEDTITARHMTPAELNNPGRRDHTFIIVEDQLEMDRLTATIGTEVANGRVDGNGRITTTAMFEVVRLRVVHPPGGGAAEVYIRQFPVQRETVRLVLEPNAAGNVDHLAGTIVRMVPFHQNPVCGV